MINRGHQSEKNLSPQMPTQGSFQRAASLPPASLPPTDWAPPPGQHCRAPHHLAAGNHGPSEPPQAGRGPLSNSALGDLSSRQLPRYRKGAAIQ